MDEHVAAAVIVGDEAVALLGIEPLDSTAEHIGYLLHVNLYPRKRRTPTGRAQSEIVLAREGRTIIWNTT